MNIVVAQIGSRMHYAVPRQFERQGALEHVYTDICADIGILGILKHIPNSFLPQTARRILSRSITGVPKARISSFNWQGVSKALYYSQRRRFSDFQAINLKQVERWCRSVSREDPASATHVYAFNSCALELFAAQKWRTTKRILEQTIAPYSFERELIARVQSSLGWASERDESTPDSAKRFSARERAEWDLADAIVCGSDFVRDALASVGGPASKCMVIPYGVGDQSRRPPVKDVPSFERRLRILFVGAVGLRKGAPWLADAAKRCASFAEFRIVGGLENCPAGIESILQEHTALLGVIPRSEVAEHYRWADVFLLPSLCEGSATVTYEAALHGLPVVCTPNTGSTIVHGKSGLLIAPESSDSICAALQLLEVNRALIPKLSAGILQLSEEQTEDGYGVRLLRAIATV